MLPDIQNILLFFEIFRFGASMERSKWHKELNLEQRERIYSIALRNFVQISNWLWKPKWTRMEKGRKIRISSIGIDREICESRFRRYEIKKLCTERWQVPVLQFCIINPGLSSWPIQRTVLRTDAGTDRCHVNPPDIPAS